MALGASSSGDVRPECDLLHPELLSRDFLLLSLGQKNIAVEDALNDKEKLTEIFVLHAMPLPQRPLPKSRWGKMMESKRGEKKHMEPQTNVESGRKRPLIVFDGSSTSTSIKVKKTENGETALRIHPPCPEKNNSARVESGAAPTSPVSHLSSPTANRQTKVVTIGNHGHMTSRPGSNVAALNLKAQSPISGVAVKIKRAAPKEDSDVTNDLKPSEAKKKIQHVTWP
ncbi:ashwin [Pseudophryne corroboree]|uniref:ashwin n=1 Tax=Pseudophryne corroboree TaxID=495146 RepID=UPI003081F133